MSSEEYFLQAIASGGDVERLVYADWLDEQGQHEKALFVRAELRHHQALRQLREAREEMEALEGSLADQWRAALAHPSEKLVLVLLRVQTGSYQDEFEMEAYLLWEEEIWPALHEALQQGASACVQYALADKEEMDEELRAAFDREFERQIAEEGALAGRHHGDAPLVWSADDTERARQLRPDRIGWDPSELPCFEPASYAGHIISLPADSAIVRVYHTIIDDVFRDYGSPEWADERPRLHER